ncbi:MAG: tRNA glutamyl-Q(34) synthetase GluQRS [Labilithrix sp.]|nr:tRNA glutamyl-Q(34) synthetase GluQRS [Labilithrix sp.]MCW5810161.1 tRNA glutamyl-Q(34) synthetase GluQRS [Labilithrix sp.]
MIATRFAPSPTGDLHVGGAWTALASWAYARAHGGRVVLRLEDIDTPRVVRGSAERIAEDLAWLGLDWDGPTIVQSTRIPIYEAALARLPTYPCDCSRAEIARAASAPHAGEETRYPGTCRDADPKRTFKRDPAIRLRVPARARVAFDDMLRGHVEEDVAKSVGDFVLRRGDGVFAYQLVVAVDDAEQVTHVLRADDLLASTARQLLLMQLLGAERVPAYGHLPLVVASDGARLAKRTRGAIVRELDRAPEEIVGELARGLGLTTREGPLTPREVADSLTEPRTWRTTTWPLRSAVDPGRERPTP